MSNSDKNWFSLSNGLYIAFCIPCNRFYKNTECLQANIEQNSLNDCHGHIQFSDQVALDFFSNFPCQSKAGVKIALAWSSALVPEEDWAMIFQIPEIGALPDNLTEKEKFFISSAEKAESPKGNSLESGNALDN